MSDYIYDIETYPNVFTIAVESADSPLRWLFEISDRRNDSKDIVQFIRYLTKTGSRMVGFNNLGFDYPVLHQLLKMGETNAYNLYQKAQAIIESQDSDRWVHQVYPTDRFIEQIDLFKIHHFDNKARATSLKVLEFNMRMDSIEDLPFPVGTMLNSDQVDVLKTYNLHDVTTTKLFYQESLPMIQFREELTSKYQRDFMNHNDTKIGKDYFIMRLQAAGVDLYEYGTSGRTPKQTLRPTLQLQSAILRSIKFDNLEFNRVLQWLKTQSISETKGVFKDLIANVGGIDFIFGTGGIHASVENRVVEATEDTLIVDLDVSSYYPNLAIANRFHPTHLGESFCGIYKNLYESRKQYKKGTIENGMLKLALNGVFGDSNSRFSVFYDPLFTMSITLNGQLLLCMLVENILEHVKNVEILQANTDGLTVKIPRTSLASLNITCKSWELSTGLELESKLYSRLFIRDVNNYLAQYTDGSVKRKGAYDYVMDWHQNHSALVVAKVAEKVLLEGAPLRETITQWDNIMDFMIRVKVPRSSKLLVNDDVSECAIQNTTRYYVSSPGVTLTKLMPPLKDKTEWRRIGVQKGRFVTVCNRIEDAGTYPIDYDYYIKEVEKLCLILN